MEDAELRLRSAADSFARMRRICSSISPPFHEVIINVQLDCVDISVISHDWELSEKARHKFRFLLRRRERWSVLPLHNQLYCKLLAHVSRLPCFFLSVNFVFLFQ